MTVKELIDNYSSNEIKKCPCCNSEAKIIYCEASRDVSKTWISCTNYYCEIQTSPIIIYNEDATNVKAANILDMIKRWNRRVKEEEKK